MSSIKKSVLLFVILIVFLAVTVPMPRTFAEANINRFSILDASSYLIAGMEYTPLFDSDKASSTDIEQVRYEYSTDNGATWRILPTYSTIVGIFSQLHFMLPIDPNLVSAKFRVSAYFNPFIGSISYSEKTIGPFQILQPGSPSNVLATANSDSTVTLSWTDNSNMESYYQITRDGPDGTHTFDVTDTMGNVGPLSYVDKTTEPYTSTIYVYTVTAVIDNYALTDDNKPGPVSAITKTKARLKLEDRVYEMDDSFVKRIEPDKNRITDKVKFADKYSQYILEVDKVAVSSVALNKNAMSMEPGGSETLTAAIVPSNAANKKVNWSSDHTDVAVVDQAGKVTAVSEGSAKITAKTESGGLSSVCVVSVAAKLENANPIPMKPLMKFSDVSGSWAIAEITKAVELGFVNGYPDGTFRPDEGVTRAEFTSMLMKGMKSTTEEEPLVFKDTSKIGAWAIPAVSKAVKLGIISGYADGTFRPNANITHAEMISMVVRASGLPVDSAEPTGFADDADIPKWAKASVSAAEKNGIIIVSGVTGDKFAPQALTTRAEAASAIVHMLMLG